MNWSMRWESCGSARAWRARERGTGSGGWLRSTIDEGEEDGAALALALALAVTVGVSLPVIDAEPITPLVPPPLAVAPATPTTLEGELRRSNLTGDTEGERADEGNMRTPFNSTWPLDIFIGAAAGVCTVLRVGVLVPFMFRVGVADG